MKDERVKDCNARHRQTDRLSNREREGNREAVTHNVQAEQQQGDDEAKDDGLGAHNVRDQRIEASHVATVGGQTS